MKCPHCGNKKSRVLETRQDPSTLLTQPRVNRVRLCTRCRSKFETAETRTITNNPRHRAEEKLQNKTTVDKPQNAR